MKPNTCFVIDVWEGQLEIDEAVLKANGVAGIGIRINDMNGGHHMDTGFAKQWAEAANFVRFPYFVYNPWVNGAANYAWLLANMPVEARSVAIDIEVSYAAVTPAAYAAEVAKFLALAKAKWRVIIYTAEWFMPKLSRWPTDIDYWWAQYPSKPYYFGSVKTWAQLKSVLDQDALAMPFNKSIIPGRLVMWQFSGDYLVLEGCKRDIDVNIFYGNEKSLADYFMSWPVGEPPSPPPPAPVVKISAVLLGDVKIPYKLTVNYSVNGLEGSQVVDQTSPPIPPPPPVEAKLPALYRIKHDLEPGVDTVNARANYVRHGLPSTVRLLGGKGFVMLTPAWMKYVYEINQPFVNYQFSDPNTLKDAVGWHNTGDGNRVEELVFSGNFVEVWKIIDGMAYIRTVPVESSPPVQIVKPLPGQPHRFIHLLSTQYNNPKSPLDMTTDGRYPRVIVMSNAGEELMIPMTELVRV